MPFSCWISQKIRPATAVTRHRPDAFQRVPHQMRARVVRIVGMSLASGDWRHIPNCPPHGYRLGPDSVAVPQIVERIERKVLGNSRDQGSFALLRQTEPRQQMGLGVDTVSEILQVGAQRREVMAEGSVDQLRNIFHHDYLGPELGCVVRHMCHQRVSRVVLDVIARYRPRETGARWAGEEDLQPVGPRRHDPRGELVSSDLRQIDCKRCNPDVPLVRCVAAESTVARARLAHLHVRGTHQTE